MKICVKLRFCETVANAKNAEKAIAYSKYIISTPKD